MAEGEKLIKSILVCNRSAHDVTLYIPKKFTKRHFLSESIIVDRGESYLFQSEEVFRFELTARVDGKNMKTIEPIRMWEKDIMLCVSGNHEPKVDDKEIELKDKQICMRRQNMKKDVSASGTKNLYQVLGLTMKEMRMNSFEEQNRIIKEAYHSQLRRWHPDKNPENGDNAICQEIINAYSILKDPNTRAAYNNIVDFDEGGLSQVKALFKPKSYRPDRARPFKRRWNKKRIGLSFLSVLFVAGGAGLTFLTAGMAAPAVLGVVTASLMGAGISSGLRTITRQSVEHGCSFRDYLISLVVGAVGGAVIGAGIAGIAGILGGAAKLAFKAAQLSLEKQISMRMVTTAFRGFITSLTNNLDAILAGGPKTTWKQFILHILFDALLGGIAGVPGGLTENMLQDVVTAEEALSAIETISTDARNSVEELTTIATKTFTDVLEERLNHDVENKAIVSHIKCAAKKAAMAVGKNSAIFVAKAAKKGFEGGKTTRINDESNNQNEENEENEENIVNPTPDVKGPHNTAKSAKFGRKEGIDATASNGVGKEGDDSNNETKEANGEGKVKHFGLKYISEGSWLSKMLVDYEKDGEKKHCEGKGSGSLIWIPSNATNIKVRFQVMRGPGVWCDVKKYNFADDHWEKPIQTHIFEYNKPRSLTYTLAGKLYHEVVKNVSLERYDNIDDNHLPKYNTLTEYHLGTMKQTLSSHEEKTSDNWDPTKQTLSSHGEKTSDTDGPVKQTLSSDEESASDNDKLTKPGKLKYISKENWLSKMLVDYEENGEEKHVQVKGSGSLIVIPDNATKIKVRFQVMRAPGVWSDVKEYDRFKKSWIKPTKPHIFVYDKPVSCTYTLAGKLCYEAVMKVSRDDDIDERIEQKYFCNGGWSSKMLVDYEEDGKVKFHQAHGSGSSIVLPNNATNINVRFQVMRFPGIWSDVKEYDRFKKCWVEPTKPHIFKYGKPASCTYTLTGGLNDAAVTKVSGDDIIDERIRLNYITGESWSSKMLVDYNVNDKKKHRESYGSGSSICLPTNATQIKVRFQVMRAPGVWSDVKEYDRFKKCWVKPTRTHIFEYNTPVSCTYTLDGNLYYEKVTKVFGDDIIDERIRLRYISRESWSSKMLVDYEENGEEKHHEAHGRGSSILIPTNATKIQVRFQVMRFPGVWSDVKEYDRFTKCWIKPTRTHIFEYDTPVSCTYTLGGNLHYEAVMKVSGDDDVEEKIKLQYFSEGSWFSKMVVDYEENGEKRLDEAHGSGSSIWLPTNATKIKVKFQVMRFPGVWSDVKEYDRFKKCWVKPTRTHIFEYDTPVSCTYTLDGNLCYEKVTKVSGDDIIDKRIRLKYISRESWSSKMLVDYEENGKLENGEAHGGGSSILIPTNATKIQVRFQVMRFPGVWSDVKEYDRFKKCWVKPTRTHIFQYDTPVSCTYTLDGNLCYEKVTKVSGDDIIDKRIRLKYISRESWSSKMLIDYEENGKPKNDEAHGGGSSILIPTNATKIQVRFQVMRFPGVWSDVKEYDRFKKCWVKPTRTHIFEYDTPVSCTYTLGGNLHYEAVMKVSGDDNVEDKIKLQYFSEGSWFSKMLVDYYEENGEEKHHNEGYGSGSLIVLPTNATNIKVRFQVMRSPGIWSDVKEYDRFKKGWVKPSKPHIFEYDTPVSCTYTLDGNLYYEKVTKVSGDDIIDERIRLKYISRESWSTKMLVDYEENGEPKNYEGEGSGSSILIPTNATNIKVRFQVMRAPGIWCDVKKYDCFKKFWVTVKQPHIFTYDTPVSCTYTLDRNVNHVAVTNVSGDDDMGEQITFKYISKGSWSSKMLVEYQVNDEKKHNEGHGSGSWILIPTNATNIEVRFQVMRAPGVWCDVKEYDRFKKCWVEPTKPQIFKYNTPVSCTYTLDGNFCYEAVTKVSGDDIIDERIRLKYITGESWSSRMLVDYEENGKKKHRESHGSGSSICLPDNATNIEVKFQVMRAPGVWSDVKEYDRFKKFWLKPTRPHIFKYDTPVSCTYTLAGKLCYGAVMKVTRDDDIDERIEQKYFCNRGWSSKMLVNYEEDGEVKFHEAHGSGSSIMLPNNATNINVRFEVMRPPGIWSDVKEYDRFKKCWVEPTQPHIFKYDTPVSCTYTLDGNLYYEAVMKVTGDDRIDERIRLNYISGESWSCKMLVDYKVNGEEEHLENYGSGSSICLPDNATQIKVRFQVMRAPGVWSDVKEYDRFKKCWVKPTKPHIFEYDTPVSCTYTLDGNLYFEKVTKVSGDDIIDERIRLKYISRESWSSKMLVDYEENGKKKHNEGHGSGSSILIPTNATKIQVRFQVKCAPGVWSDVKEYDRFKKCWVEPTKPHIFTYDKPVSCTYTLDRNLNDAAVTNVSGDDDMGEQITFKYISKGSWSSKMLVDYKVNDEKKHNEGHGSGSWILIPTNATNIEVRFQVMRAPGVWSDVKEYDRFKKCWVKPTKPHIFMYNTPLSCTYTLDGNLYYEAVTKVSGDDDVEEKIKLQYFSKGSWCSKMLVDYEENGQKRHNEGHGSGSSILIPTNATNIEVKFQVMRAPGVWCDVKEYDRFRRCWVEPTKTHIFKYGKPVSCTYTLDGNLYYEAVMKVSGDDIIDERIRLKYITGESWSSKMLVDYEENGEKKYDKSHGSGSSICLPNNATNIEVRFQVMRAPGVWCDVKEYDRFKKCWVKPTKTHIFKYDTPVSCTYTLAGNLYYEKVKRASTDDYNEDKQKNLKYISKGSWSSKMLVYYEFEEGSEKKPHEAHGTGSSIWLPNNATNIKVKFQVMRFPGVWCYVKEYDRFKKCWVKPTKTHIFEYDTPMSCTYTLDGSLYYEAVMKVTGDDDIQERIGLKYNFKGSRSSKMLVDYEEDGEEKHHKGEGSGSVIWIPNNATKIKVSFQALDSSGSWSDVNEYDHVKKCWIEPIQPHIFEYDTPISCTYTLSEIEQCKVVVKLEQGDDDIDERVRLKYISEGSWYSKMLVDYKVNGKEKNGKAEGSESSIMVPSNATDIKVKFQVMRSPGVWCDVKEYDRFKKRWIKPTKTHIFKYDTPVCRTYTLAGKLYFEKVIKITGEHYEEIADK
ncbi:uncharacterized protein LOC114538145 [Dendronephthya gigantea]|uniref:uncharacterized protein LOC114538145 n=1 Tax=Dendronephthya gigantea TaxID=151771 RepID=UPI001068F279|nr:uncharacterized protein LOC114538145 [Dendronephthya gigantea]XP_028415058.1 uncharacterized protein LOC114538145 [Dendronephthya gigantea]XP_028415059.1 uncharacterized protein LOC114538145 [Dendronephthya gigantea]